MKNNITENTPFMTPDSLRKTLQMLHNFYDTHTKKNYGYTDINGSQYSGIIENHATELLLEARKLLMDNPSLSNFITKSSFGNYFDIQYSNLISTYDQQNTLVAILKKDSLLSNKEYSITFTDCTETIVLRSESWSDPKVYRDKFYKTTTPPVLTIHDPSDSVEDINIELIVSDGTENDVEYGYLLNSTTSEFISEYNDGTLIISPITQSMFGLPFIWINLSIFNLLPPILSDNKDTDGHRLLTVGTDGHNVSRLYPLIYETDIVPGNGVMEDWYIKIIPRDDEIFSTSMNDESNYLVAIKEIHFIQTSRMGDEPISDHVLYTNDPFISVMLCKEDTLKWSFKSPVAGDYDYDGLSYINPVYGFISLTNFIANMSFDNKDLLPAFIIKFSNTYLHDYEYIDGDATSGIHVDTSSEYSNNGIDKKNGVVHGLGDFDGLPSYFTKLADRTVHRPHIELYSIRDRLNRTNQKYVDKQTAALIVDAAMPQKEIIDMLSQLVPIIKYKHRPLDPILFDDYDAGMYYSDETVEIISTKNQLSDIVFINNSTFGDVTTPRYKLLPRFIYHGNRTFSLDFIDFDQELERGRIFKISNDGAYYENNLVTNYPKADRTLLRICDIPTSFVQLINIVGVSPTLIIDEDYTRMNANLTTHELSMLYNERPNHIVFDTYEALNKSSRKYIFNASDDLDSIISINSSKLAHEIININKSLDLLEDPYSIDILSNGSGYVLGDKFISIIGGKSYRGTITGIDGNIIQSFVFDEFDEDTRTINIGNLTGTQTIMKTTTVTGNGTGLVLALTISAEVLAGLTMTLSNDICDDNIAFKYDMFDNIWIHKFDVIENKWNKCLQFTGEPFDENIYDNTSDVKSRDVRSVLIYNILKLNRTFNSNIYTDMIYHLSTILTHPTSIVNTDLLFDKTDLSAHLKGLNHQDSLYVFQKNEDVDTLVNIPVVAMEYRKFDSTYDSVNYTNQRVMPRCNILPFSKYADKSNTISIDYVNSDISQPNLYIYSPSRSVSFNVTDISKNVFSYATKTNITFMSVLYPFGLYDETLVDDNIDVLNKNPSDYIINPVTGALTTNVYSSNEYHLTTEMQTYFDELQTLDRDAIVDIIIMKYGTDASPLRFEETKLQVDKMTLIDYIMINTFNTPTYACDDIKILREANETVVKPLSDSTYEGVGDQPSGAYVSLSGDEICTTFKINNQNITADLEFIFNIPDFPIDETPSSSFIVTDDLGNDISSKSMIICNNIAYVKNSGGRWLPIKK